jgi:hypothetical protein
MERAFISHISEEAAVAARLKSVLVRDFRDPFDVFMSADTESIAAGEDWLRAVEKALRECAIVMILCSPESIRRPWINFEAGAAVQSCHTVALKVGLKRCLKWARGTGSAFPRGR